MKNSAAPDMVSIAQHERYMDAALAEAKKAFSAGQFPVGCVLVGAGDIVSVGARSNSGEGGNEMDHAEIVALRRLLEADTSIDLSRVTAYSTMEPCLMCFSTLILNGIRTIVYAYEDVMGGGSRLELAKLPPLYAAMDVSVIPGIYREQCLELFKAFFRAESNTYWQNSLLARYTLAQ